MQVTGTNVWKEGANLYMPQIYKIALKETKNIQFAEKASEDVWIYFCDNEHLNDLFNRIGSDDNLFEEIKRYTLWYCNRNHCYA